MRNSLFFSLVVLLALCFSTGCKSEFERIRTSGDPAVMLEKANAYFDQGEYLKAQTLYELIISTYRGRPEAEFIAFNYAYSYFHLEQYILAAYYFKNFAATYGGSNKKEEAEFMHAYSNYKLSPSFRLDQTYTLKAIEAFQEFINRYPNNERVSECNKLIDEMRQKLELKDFEAANLYFDLQQYRSAIRSYENLLIDFPETRRAEEVRYRITRAAYLLAQNSFVEKQEERYLEVIEKAEAFLNRYADSDYVFEVQKMLQASHNRLKQLKDV
ncbi:MAG: outer membrane protein assembly factor BamD [Bacteroidetes bacterium]|nr:MAG: outer membrane protein assembly factor BamD [Bacteroidota bacterium]